MTASTLFFVLLVLACPLMMMFMMRGGHGHRGGHAGHAGGCHGGQDHEPAPPEASTDDLRRQRADLDRLIEEREADPESDRESDRELSTWGRGWR